MREYEEKLKEDPMFDGKKTHRGPTLKISNVTVNAKSVLQATQDLEALNKVLSTDKAERRK